MVIYSQITPSIRKSGSNYFTVHEIESNFTPRKGNNYAAMSLDGIFVPYTLYSSQFPSPEGFYSVTGYNPYDHFPAYGDSTNLIIGLSMTDYGWSGYQYTGVNQFTSDLAYVPDILHSPTGKGLTSAQYYHTTGNFYTKEVAGMALKAPMIMVGWGKFAHTQQMLKNNPVLKYASAPAFPDVLDARKYLAGPLDIRWDNIRGVWRSPYNENSTYEFRPYTPTNPTGYLRDEFSRNATGLLVGDATITTCSLFSYTYQRYVFPFDYNGYTELVFDYSGGCVWRAEPINISFSNKEHIVLPTMTLSTRTENGTNVYGCVVNFTTISNEDDNTSFSVNYINHDPFNPTISLPLFLTDAPRQWRGVCGSILAPIDTYDTITKLYLDMQVDGPATGIPSAWPNTGIYFTVGDVYRKPLNFSRNKTTPNIYNFSPSFLGQDFLLVNNPSGSYLSKVTGYLDTSTNMVYSSFTFVKRNQNGQPVSTGTFNYSRNFTNLAFPWVHVESGNILNIRFAIYDQFSAK